ncbi:MAG: dimethylmenaquinone methyltransferase [Hyphomicrobiales bacterium]|nr:dimethylmenaquinone methyltransferase [Rhodoblastus sp.]MCC2113549.1 dimethylmenaquinone methyltransferase [Hyphomicrobiales bacterium]
MTTCVLQPTTPRIDAALVERWGRVPSSVAADLLAGLTVLDSAIRPLKPLGGGRRLVGLATTALCEGTDYGAVHHAIAVAEAGDVIVVEAGGRSNPAIIGELLSASARLKGIRGLVVNGAVRDVATLRTWDDFPVFTRHITPRGPSSYDRGTVNDTIAMGGVKVAPGDIVLGDDDGVVIVPHAEASVRIDSALARVAAEEAWERELLAGRSTLDVFNIPRAR